MGSLQLDYILSDNQTDYEPLYLEVNPNASTPKMSEIILYYTRVLYNSTTVENISVEEVKPIIRIDTLMTIAHIGLTYIVN